jgi:hypothetical protein
MMTTMPEAKMYPRFDNCPFRQAGHKSPRQLNNFLRLPTLE